jgi:hypothetical protein
LGVVIATMTLLAFAWTARSAPVVAFALLWTVAMYLPVSNLLPVSHFFVAERYLYVPSFGICLLLALMLDALAGVQYRTHRGHVWAAAVACLIVAAGAARTFHRTLDWRDSLTFWSANVHSVPEASARANFSLGLALFREERPAEAIPHFERAVKMVPHFPPYRRMLDRARERAADPGTSE